METFITYAFLFLFGEYVATAVLSLTMHPVMLGVRKLYLLGATTLGFISLSHRIFMYYVLIDIIGYNSPRALSIIGNDHYTLATVIAAISVQTFVLLVVSLVFIRSSAERIQDELNESGSR